MNCERERLIEVLQNCRIQTRVTGDISYKSAYEKIADYLLASGVIVPPVKVGDRVYQKGIMYSKCSAYDNTPINSFCTDCCAECDSKSYEYMYTGTISYMTYNGEQFSYIVKWDDKWDNSHYVIGKNIFLTASEAEKALKGGVE